jgi:FtsZ-binding cell division protein ZapB
MYSDTMWKRMPMAKIFAGRFGEQIENTTKIGLTVRKLSDDNEKMITEISNFIHPLDDLRLKFESVLNKSVELNEPFKETNIQLKENFENLVKSINDLQIRNNGLVSSLNTYASSLESNLGAKLSNIVEAENLGQTMVKSLFDLQTTLSKSVENLNSYSKDLGDASRLLVDSIDKQLNALFVDLSSRQNIAINVNNTPNDITQRTENILEKQYKISLNIFKSLTNLNESVEDMLRSIIKPPFFSKERWFGNGNQKEKKTFF